MHNYIAACKSTYNLLVLQILSIVFQKEFSFFYTEGSIFRKDYLLKLFHTIFILAIKVQILSTSYHHRGVMRLPLPIPF